MPPLPILDTDLQRAIILLLPFLIAGAAILIMQPPKRMMAGAFLATLWNFIILVLANVLATKMGWWTFNGDKHLILGQPFDVLLGWSIWWGAALILIFKVKHFFLALLLALWIDLLVMPNLFPLVTLGDNWLLGEVLVLTTCLIPGWLIALTTTRDIYVGWRAAAQAVMTGVLLFILMPAALLEYSGSTLVEIALKPEWQLSVIFNALLLPLVLGLAGNQEFAERGHGTPIPFDPPKHLVVTGPYAYLANPMQLSIFLSLIILGIAYQSELILASAVIALIYCLGVVQWHHTIDMEPRFGERWSEYKHHVRNWLPRWKPWIREPSTVFFAKYCDICQDTEHWLQRLRPTGLIIEDAAKHSESLDRVTYHYPDGSEVKGIYAIASCLNHINFAFAFLGWLMRLPIIRHFLQILIDGTGKRAEPTKPDAASN